MSQEKRTGNLPEKIENFVAEKSKKKAIRFRRIAKRVWLGVVVAIICSKSHAKITMH